MPRIRSSLTIGDGLVDVSVDIFALVYIRGVLDIRARRMFPDGEHGLLQKKVPGYIMPSFSAAVFTGPRYQKSSTFNLAGSPCIEPEAVKNSKSCFTESALPPLAG